MPYIAIYLAAAFGFAFGFITCAILANSRDRHTHHDEHEEFPGC